MIYLLATVGFFGLMWLFVIGCDAIIGPDDESTTLSATPDDEFASISSSHS
jgi:hypothetical protein